MCVFFKRALQERLTIISLLLTRLPSLLFATLLKPPLLPRSPHQPSREESFPTWASPFLRRPRSEVLTSLPASFALKAENQHQREKFIPIPASLDCLNGGVGNGSPFCSLPSFTNVYTWGFVLLSHLNKINHSFLGVVFFVTEWFVNKCYNWPSVKKPKKLFNTNIKVNRHSTNAYKNSGLQLMLLNLHFDSGYCRRRSL